MCYSFSVEALAALADPTRRELIGLLAGGEIAAGELAERFPVSRPAISRHLRVLRESGLVRTRTDGRRRLYALDPAPLRELDAWLEPYRDLWAQRLDALDTEIAGGGRAPPQKGPPCPTARTPAAASSPPSPTAPDGWCSAAPGPPRSRTSGRRSPRTSGPPAG